MQRVLFQQTDTSQLQVAHDSVMPGHGTGVRVEAVNDEDYQQETSKWRMVLSVLGNVLGGSVLLAGLYFLPQVFAIILG
ncbi:MAG: hypothetical protein HKP21_11850 [Xanthomonadales bacterium]|nr:hypothetical protein [Gammaproteobacteria bacterium]MBT8076899.1 hypothetical protein [Gammaproteobacteria bacterium]NNK05240.1 hypothetical protein [Xanthomonadales bacterium]